jgi:tetratricopeptide (TPR) repeat protein
VAWLWKERLAASRFKGALSELQEPSIVSALPSATKHETHAQIITVWSGRATTTSIAHTARTSGFPLLSHCAGGFGLRVSAGDLDGHKDHLLLPPGGSNSLKSDWQSHVLASSGYVELGMLDDAAMVLEEIAPEDKTRNEVLGARVVLYTAAQKWDMAEAIASHLVKVDPNNEAWWIHLAYSVRRIEGVEKAEAILLRAMAIHPKIAMIAFHLACCASVMGRIEEAKDRLRQAIKLDEDIRLLALDDQDLRPLWHWLAHG